jgi:hypothetical protein
LISDNESGDESPAFAVVDESENHSPVPTVQESKAEGQYSVQNSAFQENRGLGVGREMIKQTMKQKGVEGGMQRAHIVAEGIEFSPGKEFVHRREGKRGEKKKMQKEEEQNQGKKTEKAAKFSETFNKVNTKVKMELKKFGEDDDSDSESQIADNLDSSDCALDSHSFSDQLSVGIVDRDASSESDNSCNILDNSKNSDSSTLNHNQAHYDEQYRHNEERKALEKTMKFRSKFNAKEHLEEILINLVKNGKRDVLDQLAWEFDEIQRKNTQESERQMVLDAYNFLFVLGFDYPLNVMVMLRGHM